MTPEACASSHAWSGARARESVERDGAEVAFMGAGLQEFRDLRDREAELLVGCEEVRAEADPAPGR